MGRKIIAIILILACFVASLGVFTGCGKKSREPSNTTPSESGNTSGEAEEDVKFEDIRLSFPNDTVTYSGEAWEPEVVGRKQGDTVVFNILKNGSAVSEAKNAGTYEFTATVTREGYQPLTTNTVALMVKKAQAVITAQNKQIFPFDGNYHYVNATLNHSETGLALRSKAFVAVGSYEFTLCARETENYLAATPVKVSVEVTESYSPAAEPSTPGAINIPAAALATEHDGKVVTTSTFSYSGYSGNDSSFTLPIYYANSMLLQGNMATKLIGKSSVQGNVAVLVSKNGYSQAFFGTTSSTAEGGKYPFEIFVKVPYGVGYTVTFINQNKQAKSISDVAFGELFIAGGQSNMGWAMSQCYDGKGGLLYNSDISSSSNDMIRLGSMWPKENASPINYDGVTSYNTWSKANPEKVKSFSAVAYFFVRELQEQYPDVPIGIFSSCMGGTNIYTWMQWNSYEKAINNGWAGERNSVSDDPGASNPAASGSRYYNAMINPLNGLTPRGVLWYQGCGHPVNYSNLLGLMIEDWRNLFDNQKLWFIDCGLPRYGGEEGWYACRDEHKYASTKIENLIYSTNVDSGLYVQFVDSKDNLNGDGIHPYVKKPVGEHAAHVTMKHFYGAKGTWGGPEIKELSVRGSDVFLTLHNVAEGLVLKGLAGFEIAGEDAVFHTATPKLISKTTIVVTCDKVKNPVQIRYGMKNYSEHAEKNKITSATDSVSVFNKKGNENWPLDQFWFDIDAAAKTVSRIEWRETKYVSVAASGLYSQYSINDSFNVAFSTTDVMAIKGEITLLPSVSVSKNGVDVSKDVSVKIQYADGTDASIVDNTVLLEKAGSAAIVYLYGGEEIASISLDVLDIVTVKTFAMKEGPFSVTLGSVFEIPEMLYVIEDEDGNFIAEATDFLRIVANYGAYTETVTDSYVQKIASDYTLQFYYGKTVVAEREVKVSLSDKHKGNQIAKNVWEKIPEQNGDGIGGYLFYNGTVNYRFAYNISASGSVIYPVRGSMLNTSNLNSFKGLSVCVGNKDGKACLKLVINGSEVLTETVMEDVNVSSGAEHVLSYTARDEFDGATFLGVRVIASMDGKERINYLVTSEIINKSDAYREYCLKPTWIFKLTKALNRAIYLDGGADCIYALDGEYPLYLKRNETANLPTANVIFPDKIIKASVYVDGAAADIGAYVFSEKKAYKISYRYNGQVLYERSMLCADNFQFTVNSVAQTQAPGTIALPSITATEDGVGVSQNISVVVRMGAKQVATVAGNVTSISHNVVSELQLTYYYKNAEVGSAKITVAPSGNIVANGSGWTNQNGAKTYGNLRQYNARVNVTYLVKSDMSGVISIPLRGNNFNNVTFWDGLALRPSARDCFLMNPLKNGDKYYNEFSQGATNKYHVISYQAVDVLNRDGSLKEIHVYIWLDGVLKSGNGGDYTVISASDSANFYDTFREEAPFIIGVNSGFEIVSITFGDKAPLDYLADIQLSGSEVTKNGNEYLIPYGTDYKFTTTGISASVKEVKYSIRGQNNYTLTEAAQLGKYTARILVSANGFEDKYYYVNFELKQNVMSGLEIFGQTASYGEAAKVIFENLPEGATVTYTYGSKVNTTEAPILTEAGTLSVSVTVTKYGYQTVSKTVKLTVLSVGTGEDWTPQMIEQLSAKSVTAVYLGTPYTYRASTTLSGVSIEYYYAGEQLSGGFSASAPGSYELTVRFLRSGYKAYTVNVTVKVIELEAKDVALNVTGVDKVTAGVTFTLPTATATHKITGEDLTAYLVRSAAYGAYPITVNANATTYTSNVFGTITFTYKIKGVTVGTKDVEVGYSGNLITGGSWSNGILNNYTVYNARVNVTFSVAAASSQMFFVPLRGTSTSLPWWGNESGAMSFRIPAQRNAEWWWICDNGNGIGAINSNYIYEDKGNWLSGTQHTFSYQVKDVLNADGTIKEIRVYCWIDNVAICLGTTAGRNGIVQVDDNMGTLTGYFVVDANNSNWKSWFTKPANLVQFALTGGGSITTSSITIG